MSRAPLPEGGWVLVLHDETTRRQVEEMRAEQARERIRADFVASVSHELRTPLTSILGFTDTLLAHDTSAAAARRYLEIVRREGERLKRLIEALLDLRQLGEGRFSVAGEPLDLRTVLAEQVEVFSEQTDEHEVVLSMPAEPLRVRGERQRLEQVVANLISNAIKYSPAGGRVAVDGVADNGRVRVTVTDAGLGIPADQHASVFTKFFRVHTPDRSRIQGSGLGLALAREIVEAHGGDIGFESAEGVGSTFYFELPLAD